MGQIRQSLTPRRKRRRGRPHSCRGARISPARNSSSQPTIAPGLSFRRAEGLTRRLARVPASQVRILGLGTLPHMQPSRPQHREKCYADVETHPARGGAHLAWLRGNWTRCDPGFSSVLRCTQSRNQPPGTEIHIRPVVSNRKTMSCREPSWDEKMSGNWQPPVLTNPPFRKIEMPGARIAVERRPGRRHRPESGYPLTEPD